jgi:outer membrane protein assembly factor BamE (lipoprotein component of BamABCDE complex)
MQKKLQQLLIIFQHFHSQNQWFYTFSLQMGRNNIPTMLNSFDTGSDFIITEQRLHFKIQSSLVLMISSDTLPITDNFELELVTMFIYYL